MTDVPIMNGHGRRSRPVRTLVTAALMLSVLPGLVTQPTVASAGPPAATSSNPDQLDVAQALATARSTGRSVAAGALTDPVSQVTANPNGTLTRQVSLRPVRVRRGDGWVGLDANLVRNGDGSYSPKATTGSVRLSGGGSGPLMTLKNRGDDISVTFPLTLPTPTVSGRTATYAGVLPDVDLVVTADEQGGVAQTLVVKTPAAARHPALDRLRLRTSSRNLSATTDGQGRVSLKDRSGRVAYSSPPALMWDSAPAPAGATAAKPGTVDRRLVEATGGAPIDATTGEPMASTPQAPGMAARTAIMAVAASSAGIDVTPDRAMLSDPKTVYPVMIDPTLQPNVWSAYGDWAEVESGKPDYKGWHQSGEAQIGHCVWPGPPPNGCNGIGVTRSYFQWNIAGLYNTAIISAQVNFTQQYAVNCNSITYVDWTNPIGPSTDWNTKPAVFATPGASGTCGGAMSANVTDQLRYAVNNRTGTSTYGLRAADESTGNGWKKFTQWNATLSVNWDVTPVTPSNTFTSPVMWCTSATPYPAIGKTDLSLGVQTVVASDGVAKPLEAQFVVTNLGTGTVVASPTVQTTAGAWTIVPIPQNTLGNGSYSWTARVFDGLLYSGWTPLCKFQVDQSQPGVPDIQSTDYPDDGVTGKPVRTPGTVTFTPPAGSSTPTQYRYQLGGGLPITVNATNGAWTGAITPTRIGPNMLTVQALSSVGTPSPAAQHVVLATRPDNPDVEGDLTGDGNPDLLTVGGTGGTAAGLWLTPGNGNGGLRTPTNIGIRGTALTTTVGSPQDWAGTLVTTGQFTGSGMQDILAVAPNGTVSIYTGPGDGSALSLASGTISGLFGGSFLDPNWEPMPAAGQTQTITQITAIGHLPEDSLPSTDGAYPDLLAVVNNNGDHQLWWFEHGMGTGLYGTAAVVLDDTIDWSTKTITGTTRGGQPALLVRDNTTGKLDLYSTNCTADCYNLNWFTDATYTLAKSATSALTLTNAPGIVANDTNKDGNPDLWSIKSTGASTYTAGNAAGTYGTLAAAGTVIPPVSAGLIPLGAVNWKNPATNQMQTDFYAANPAGQLLQFQRLPSGILGPPSTVGAAGWHQLTPFGIADFNHDNYPDLIVRNNVNGDELIYRGSPTGFAPGLLFGVGWNGFTPYGVADWNHDGHFDVIAADSAGTEWLYPGDLTSGAGNRVAIGGGLSSAYTPFGIIDFNTDGHHDILTRYSPNDTLKLYTGDATGGHYNDNGIQMGSGFNGWTFVALVNYNSDPTHPDLIARHPTNGTIRMFTGDGHGLWSDGLGVVIANGW
ncbi:MAG TPA: hypothetical protein VFV67_28925 [Actinophytocola sp.]|uniref:hypothetical protein n=1 Tax=Actinophytocola sp. TaxID=1872138 RepID=UPI002DBC2645|nr:hypothetical protein [Actinophytocola sp.]HEU5474691.1 hypothetical protein [Actinophytocola sp.]